MSISHLIEQYQEAPPRTNRPEITWDEARTFVLQVPSENVVELAPGTDFAPHAACLMIGVKKSSHHDFPYYRMVFGTILGEGHVVTHVSPRASLDQLRLGTIVWDGTFEGVARLLKAAEAWIQIDQSWAVDRYIQRLQQRGADRVRQGDRAKHGSGKTERNRAKGKAKPRKE